MTLTAPSLVMRHALGTATDGYLRTTQPNNTSQTWQTANTALYMPINVRHRVIVKKMWYDNSTTATGNYDIGLYDASGTALLRKGSTAKTTTSAIIVWDCTDTTIGPGLYYVALVSDTATDTFRGVSSGHYWINGPAGVFEEASAFPLPATATFAMPTTINRLPNAGVFFDTRMT